MKVLTTFNRVLEELPSISENLKDFIMKKGWSEEKSHQAISIIQQLQNGDLIKTGLCLSYSYVALSDLSISLSPSECGINNTVFESENIHQADKYIKELLTDINRLSKVVKFSLRGHNYENDVCTFYIAWEF